MISDKYTYPHLLVKENLTFIEKFRSLCFIQVFHLASWTFLSTNKFA